MVSYTYTYTYIYASAHTKERKIATNAINLKYVQMREDANERDGKETDQIETHEKGEREKENAMNKRILVLAFSCSTSMITRFYALLNHRKIALRLLFVVLMVMYVLSGIDRIARFKLRYINLCQLKT